MNPTDEYGYVKFTGDYSKLKSMGFTFQKLYAGNYMQWAKNHFRVWKKGSDITHDRYDLYKLIRFLETNPVMRKHTLRKGTSYSFYKFYDNVDDNIYQYYPRDEKNNKRYTDYMSAVHEHCEDETKPMPEYLGDTEWVDESLIDYIREWKNMDWYELDYYPENT